MKLDEIRNREIMKRNKEWNQYINGKRGRKDGIMRQGVCMYFILFLDTAQFLFYKAEII